MSVRWLTISGGYRFAGLLKRSLRETLQQALVLSRTKKSAVLLSRLILW